MAGTEQAHRRRRAAGRWWSSRVRAARAGLEPGAGVALLVILAFVVVVAAAYQPMQGYLIDVAAAEAAAVSDPDGSPRAAVPVGRLDVLYASLQLFVLNLPPVTVVPLPASLRVLRLLAPSLGVISVVLLVSRWARLVLSGFVVRRWRGHEVFCGAGGSCVGLARLRAKQLRTEHPWWRRRRRVVLVAPALSDEVRRDLRRHGVVAVAGRPGIHRGGFSNAVSGARSVYVDLGSDQETMAYAVAALGVGTTSGSTAGLWPAPAARKVTAVIDSSELPKLGTLVDDDRLQLLPRWRRVSSAAVGVAGYRRASRGPLHVIVISDTPSVATVIDDVLASANPAEDARVTVLVREGSRLDGQDLSRPDVHTETVAISSTAAMVLSLDRIGNDPPQATAAAAAPLPISDPLLVLLEDPLDLLTTLAELIDDRELSFRLVVIEERSTTPIAELLAAAPVSEQRLWQVRPTDLAGLGLFSTGFTADDLADLLQRSYDGWTSPELRGPHPVQHLTGPLVPSAGTQPSRAALRGAAERILAALEAAGLTVEENHHGVHLLGPADLAAFAAALGELAGAPTGAAGTLDEQQALVRIAGFAQLADLLCGLVRTDRLSLTPTGAAAGRFRPSDQQLRDLAREIHRSYLSNQVSEGRPLTDAQVDWDRLSPLLRESNLAQARSIPLKLVVLGLDLEVADGPRPAWPAGPPGDAAVALLSELEHRRWCADLLDRGYRHGPTTDRTKRLHSQLIPYASLVRDERNKDAETVLALPEVTAGADLRLRLLAPAMSPPGRHGG